jgi:hypothetical protein
MTGTPGDNARWDTVERDIAQMASWDCNRARNFVSFTRAAELEPTEKEKAEFLASLRFDHPTPGEVDEMARVDELRRKHGRAPHEL